MNERRDPEVTDRAVRGDAVALARALVSTPSVNPALSRVGRGEAEIADLCAGWLEEWGFETRVDEVEPGRCNVVARTGAGPRSVILNGHLDTVGVEGMTVPPFGGAIEDGRLVGRGACDMKGGVASLLSAAAGLARRPAGGEVQVVLTADEEHASLGMASFVAEGARADMAVVCEPTDLTVMPAHKGFVWIDTLFRGRAAHGSRPEAGIDAVRHAGLYLAALEDLHEALADATPHLLLGRGSFHVGTIEGGSAPSIYPAACEVSVERRTLPGEDPDEVVAAFRRILADLEDRVPEVDAELRRGLVRPGTEVPEDAEVVRTLLDAARTEGVEPRVAGMTAWVDAAFLNEAGIPAICFGPGDTAQAHTADEWCEVAQIERCARILERFVRASFS